MSKYGREGHARGAYNNEMILKSCYILSRNGKNFVENVKLNIYIFRLFIKDSLKLRYIIYIYLLNLQFTKGY